MNITTNLSSIQSSLRTSDVDAWLFFDVWHRDPLAYQLLDLGQGQLTTRRWYYLIQANGLPIKIVHRIEADRLASLPGITVSYSGWRELHQRLKDALGGYHKVAMQYSPNNALFNISYVDAGTIELIRSFGPEVVSSADLIRLFGSKLDAEGIRSHVEASRLVQDIKDAAFQLIFDSIRDQRPKTEYEIQQFIVSEFARYNLTSDGLDPVVAVNDHAANPHFEVNKENNRSIRSGDRILIDLWARLIVPNGIYYDITWCGYAGQTPPEEYATIFSIVTEARNRAKEFVINRLKNQERVLGYEVDDVCRSFISSKGYGEYFTHRTGHSIDTKVHGSGVNIDNYETSDHRELGPGSCFSIEPGIYKDDIGARSEIDVLIDQNGDVIVEGREQRELLLME